MNLDQGVIQVHIEDIIPNRFQPRLNFDEEGLKELSDSIKEHGIIQPLVLRKLGDKYEIVAGERRYKAASMAGLTTVPAVISNIDDNKAAEVAIVENVQRRNLTAIEEARSYKNLLDKGYLTQDELAKKMGLSQPAIANKLRLLNLDDEVQQALLDEKISERHARTLLRIKDKEIQKDWLHRIINERLTVRQLDEELKKANVDTDDEESDGVEGGVPLVEAQATTEEIKANSRDIRDLNAKMSIEDMMKPTEIVNEEIETLEENIPTNNNTIIESPKSTEYMNYNPIMNNNDNKFFNFESSTNDKPKEENTFIENNNNELEIIDDFKPLEDDKPSLTSTSQAMSNPFEIIEPKKEEKPENDLLMNNNSISTEFNISSNNKFFTPIKETKEELNIPKIEEHIENPMDRVKRLDPDYKEESEVQKEYTLKDSINSVRKTIDEIGKRGIYAEVDEIDFEDYYEITIKIFKDNN